MSNKQKNKPFSLSFIISIAVALVVTGGVASWFTYNRLTSSNSTKPTLSPSAQPVEPVKPPVNEEKQPQQETITVYWLKMTPTKTELQPASITVQKSTDKKQILETAFQELLSGPKEQNYVSTIPQGTKLLGIKVEKDGVHINLSAKFTTEEGAVGMIGRLAQVIYTATSLDPKAAVWISVEGKPLELLGEGDGLMVDQPMTRQSFEENFQL